MNLVYCDESSLGILSPGGHGLYKFEPGWAQAKALLKKVKHKPSPSKPYMSILLKFYLFHIKIVHH